ncbi:hypothetical protein NW764_015797 [Fusarium oxysporum]|nr:hypothetical protein NW764_015797 [Fusarium oxysporum]
MGPGSPREDPSPKLDTKEAGAQRSHSSDGGNNPYEDSLIESLIDSYKSTIPEPTEGYLQRQLGRPAQIRRVAVSDKELSPALLSQSVAELTRQCVSAFQICISHEMLMKHQWADNRFADFNLFVDGVGALSASRVSVDSRLESRPDDLILIKTILMMLEDFLTQCIRCVQTQSRTDEAVGKVDSSLENLALVAVAIRKTGKRSRLKKADRRFKPEEHKKLKDFLRILCLRQGTKKEPGNEAEKDDFKFEKLSSQEFINTSKEFELSEPQQRLIEVNLRRRNCFLRAQEHSEKLKARQTEEPAKAGDAGEEADTKTKQLPNVEAISHGNLVENTTRDYNQGIIPHAHTTPETKASTAEGSFKVRRTKKTPSQHAMTAITTLTAAARYPKAPKTCKESKMFKCPCCCQTLPAEFGTDKDLWKYCS